ncbi:MAG: hypothetical protein R3F56_01040 [Planctomycetota bacterium]
MKRTLLVLHLVAFGGRGLSAQAPTRVDARVSAAAGSAVYFDKGRDADVAIGDTARIFVPGQAPLDLVVRAVSKSSSRADLPAGAATVPIGTRVEITVTTPSAGNGGEGNGQESPPPVTPRVDHPPWSQPLDGVDPKQPLLAPAFGRGPADRPTDVHGRLFAYLTHTWDGGYNDRRYLLGRVGADVDVENPLGKGGALHFDGEYDRRQTMLDDAPDVTSSRTRIDRLSYSWGDDTLAPLRFEVGRFLQHQFPELGMVDGGEITLPVTDHGAFGTSLGLMPEPFGSARSSDDLQASVGYRYENLERSGVRTGVAVQKTWHEGKEDRDLLFGDFFWRTESRFTLQVSSWVDYYTGTDVIKAHGLQLTELHARTAYDFSDDQGVGLNFGHIRWPELKRNEFSLLPPDLVRDNRIDRFGADAWWRATELWRFDVRGDYWQDQRQDGYSADVRSSLRDTLWQHGDVSASVYYNEGSFTNGYGVRLGAAKSFGAHRLTVRYDWSRYENTTLFGGDANLSLQGVTVDLDLLVGRRFDVSIDLDHRFGDAQSATTLGIYGQVRF